MRSTHQHTCPVRLGQHRTRRWDGRLLQRPLEQVPLNVVVNAAQVIAAEREGTGPQTFGGIRIRTERLEDGVPITVGDDGSGRTITSKARSLTPPSPRTPVGRGAPKDRKLPVSDPLNIASLNEFGRQVGSEVAGRLWQLVVQTTSGFAATTGRSLSIPARGTGVLLLAALSTSVTGP